MLLMMMKITLPLAKSLLSGLSLAHANNAIYVVNLPFSISHDTCKMVAHIYLYLRNRHETTSINVCGGVFLFIQNKSFN